MTATRILAATITAVLWGAAAVLLWRTEVPAGLELAPPPAAVEFAPERLREAERFAGFLRGLWLVSTAAQLAALALVAWRAPRLERRLRGGRLLRGLTLLVVALAVLWLGRLPFAAVGHWWRRRYGLSEQGYLDWLADPWPERLWFVAAAAVAVAAAMLLARVLGRRWWLAGGPLLAVVGAGLVLAQPLVEAQRLEPLEDPALEREVLDLAAGMGVDAVGVDVKDASRRTTGVNAEVVGEGATRRIVLWDTLLDGRTTPAEIRFLVAHELAHVERAHIRRGVAWFALLAPLLVLALAVATRPRGGLAQPVAVPLAVLAAFVLQLGVLPLENAISRRYEAEADWIALEATRDPAAARALFHRFVEENLADPDPPRWARVLRGTHPSLLERIAMAEAFSRTRGGPSPAGS